VRHVGNDEDRGRSRRPDAEDQDCRIGRVLRTRWTDDLEVG
jgi:hypothetical protein